MQIRTAEKKDLPMIMDIIHQAQNSLKELGISQWQNGYPNEDTILADMEQAISYVLTENDQILATAAISFHEEPTYKEIFDGTFRSNEPYGVVHRIAVSSSCKNQGLAAQVMSFAKDLCQKHGLHWIRIDTHEGNLPMQHFLKKQGFEYCGIIYLSSKHNADTKRLAYDYQIR